MIINVIIPRGLGPSDYGSFTFATGIAQKLFSFFDQNLSLALLKKYSAEQKNYGLVKFYALLILIISVLIFGLHLLTYGTSYYNEVWINQEIKIINFALIFGFMLWLEHTFVVILDALSLTKLAEISKFISKVVSFIFLCGFFFIGDLSIYQVFTYHFIFFFFFILCSIYYIQKNHPRYFSKVFSSSLAVNKNALYFFNYTHPLFFKSIFQIGLGVFEIWILQYYGGSLEQGYFGFAFKLSALSFLIVASMTDLITREFSVFIEKNDRKSLIKYYSIIIPLLFSLMSFISIFLFTFSKEITLLIAGDDYMLASSSVAIMLLYPIHQTFGRLNDAIFFASGKTALYRNISISISIFGFLLTILLVTPFFNIGYNLGAYGLSIKMILATLIGTNINLFVISKYLMLSYLQNFFLQIRILFCFGIISQSVKYLLFKLIVGNTLIVCLLTFLVYTAIIGVVLFFFPAFTFLNKKDQQNAYKILKSFNFRTLNKRYK